MKKYTPKERVILKKLRDSNQRKFIELCEGAGYLSIALDFYYKGGERDLERAVGLAKKLVNVPTRIKKNLIRRLKSSYEERLSECVFRPSGIPGREMGDAYHHMSVENTTKEYDRKLRNIPTMARDLGIDVPE